MRRSSMLRAICPPPPVLVACIAFSSLVIFVHYARQCSVPSRNGGSAIDGLGSHKAPVLSLDAEFLRNSMSRLRDVTKDYCGCYCHANDAPGKLPSGQWWDRVRRNLTDAEFDEKVIMPHSPSGKKFTLAEVQAVARSTLKPGFLVPNISHFVLPFGNTNLQFHHMVSLLSCLHVMKPHRLLLWYAPGKEHQSDVMRMEAVLTVGGVYMDIDVLVLKPLEPLRKFPCTIGREVPYGLCNGVFMSAPSGTFLAMWHTAYQVFNDEAWVDHSVMLPHSIQAAFPDLCHVEDDSMDRPNWTPEEVNWIYGIGQQSRWDWRSKNYVMHLWFRKYGRQHNMENIKLLDSMFGQMCRYILYGVL